MDDLHATKGRKKSEGEGESLSQLTEGLDSKRDLLSLQGESERGAEEEGRRKETFKPE